MTTQDIICGRTMLPTKWQGWPINWLFICDVALVTLFYLCYDICYIEYASCYIGYTLNNLAYTLLPCLHCCPWYPRLQPFRQVPLMWWHCSSLTQLPHASAQSCPKVWPSHSVEYPNINTKIRWNKSLRHPLHLYSHTSRLPQYNTKNEVAENTRYF